METEEGLVDSEVCGERERGRGRDNIRSGTSIGAWALGVIGSPFLPPVGMSIGQFSPRCDITHGSGPNL